MLVVPNVLGVLVPNIFGSMGCDCGPLRRCPSAEKAVLFPSAARRFAQPCQSMVEIPEAVVHERDLSIKCVQSAVSEAKTTRAARRRECTAPRRGRGAHARDSSIARCTRPSAVQHSTQKVPSAFGPQMMISQTGADGPNSIRSTNRGPGQKAV